MKVSDEEILVELLECTPKQLKKLRRLFKQVGKYNISVSEIITTVKGEYVNPPAEMTYEHICKTTLYVFRDMLVAYFNARAMQDDNQKIVEYIRETPVHLNLKKLKFKGYLDNLPLDGNWKEDYLYLIYHLNQNHDNKHQSNTKKV